MSTTPKPGSSVESLARAWHALSDHAAHGTPFGGSTCNCTAIAPRIRQILDWFTAEPQPEPEGLGAVVTNPVTGGVWVRAAHPAFPWANAEEEAPEQWCDPTSEDWYLWPNLPRPLVVQTPGWTPSPPPQPRPSVPEPTGIGAVATDGEDHTWVRVHHGRTGWHRADPDPTGIGYAATWEDLHQPVTIHSHGWEPSS